MLETCLRTTLFLYLLSMSLINKEIFVDPACGSFLSFHLLFVIEQIKTTRLLKQLEMHSSNMLCHNFSLVVLFPQ